jgi:hypothetical protein
MKTQWKQYGDVHHTYSKKVSAIVYPYAKGYHWEAFLVDETVQHGQTPTLNEALSHVEREVLV